jgi:hypothetical protein
VIACLVSPRHPVTLSPLGGTVFMCVPLNAAAQACCHQIVCKKLTAMSFFYAQIPTRRRDSQDRLGALQKGE